MTSKKRRPATSKASAWSAKKRRAYLDAVRKQATTNRYGALDMKCPRCQYEYRVPYLESPGATLLFSGGAGAAKEQESPEKEALFNRAAEWLKQDQERIALDAARVPPAAPVPLGGDGRRKRTANRRCDHRGWTFTAGVANCQKCGPIETPPSPRPRR